MNGKNILVTGGAGMIGSNLVKRLVQSGARVQVADNLWRGRREYLKIDGIHVIDMDRQFLELDLSVPGALDPHLSDVEYVIHLADIVAGISYVFGNQGFVFRQNMMIDSNVIESCRKHKPAGFLYAGTACSFPAEKQTGVDAVPLAESDQFPANPESAYGWSKLMGEYQSFLMEQELDVPVSILSFHNVYGTPCDYSESTSQVIPSLIRKAIDYPANPFIVWGTGKQGRAFVHVDDIVDAIMAALIHGWGQGVIQIGPNTCTSIRSLAELIVEISGKEIDVQFDISKPEGDRGRCADFSKAKEILGWNPQTPIHSGLAELYAWMEEKIDRQKHSTNC